ncbi:MAG: XdhC family protein [bacterium]
MLRLLDLIDKTPGGVVGTLISTEGHTYKKAGEKALFEPGNPFPIFGNLGSLCVDQELLRVATEVVADEKPRILGIDTRDPSDVHFGYGVYCGGTMEVLIEPLTESNRGIYRRLHAFVRENRTVYLVHDLVTGNLALSETSPTPEHERMFVEKVEKRPDVFLFGATPLAERMAAELVDMAFFVHIVDWRPAYLEKFSRRDDVVAHENECVFDAESFVVILSHSFDRDREVLERALDTGCRYVGLMSSTTRRNAIYDALRGDGVAEEALVRIHSPIGKNLGGRSDAEIAVAILAELIEERYR